jgi:RAT1-interacting protein
MNQATFDLQPLNRFGGSNTTIRRPKVRNDLDLSTDTRRIYSSPSPKTTLSNSSHVQEIACFSYDQERRFSLGDSSIAYYYPPSLPADLNIGFNTFQKLNDVADEHLDALLDTIVAMEKETGKKCETDIVTWRGMMTKVGEMHDAGCNGKYMLIVI